MEFRRIYLDNQATTPVDPRVFQAMEPFFREKFGNAASRTHVFGWEAEEAVARAREQVAALIGAEPREIIFVSGGTEANNLVLKGLAGVHHQQKRHIIVSAIEHKSVLVPVQSLAKMGFEVTLVPVDRRGFVAPERVNKLIREDTLLVSVMAANNEIGTLEPWEAVGAICRERGVFFHTDAAQAAGKIPLDVRSGVVDFMSLSAHKMYGPKGIGALYLRGGTKAISLQPLLEGGGHEQGLRSGTLNVPAIVGFGRAAEIALEELDGERERLTKLRNKFWLKLRTELPQVRLNGSPENRLPGNLNLTFPGVEAEALLMRMPEVALSTGAACGSGTVEPSHVLQAIGLSKADARCTIRLSIGRFNTEEELDFVIDRLITEIKGVRRRIR